MAKDKQGTQGDIQSAGATEDIAAAQAAQEVRSGKIGGLGPPTPDAPVVGHLSFGPPPAPTPPPTVLGATDQFTPLQIRALDDTGGSLAREFALGAAKMCESPVLQPKTKERARRLLRLAIASLE